MGIDWIAELVLTDSLNTVARIAYHSSDVILSVQPTLAADSIFSIHFKRLASRQTPGLTASGVPEVRPLLPVFIGLS